MRKSPIRYALCFWMAGLALVGAANEKAPDEQEVRKRVDALIRKCQEAKKRASLGLMDEAISLSISFGAPAYNQGDHEACCRFYTKTAESLLRAFEKEGDATAPARKAILDLDAALKRLDGFLSVDGKAWTLRFAFDRATLSWRMLEAHAQGLVAIGAQYFALEHYEEAELAFVQAVEQLLELEGSFPERCSINVRIAPFELGHALYAQGKFKAAATAIIAGLEYIPDWPTQAINQLGFYGHPERHEQILERLQAAIEKANPDADLEFLLGHEFYFTARQAQGQEHFARALALVPNHAGATIFKKTDPNSPLQKRIVLAILRLNAEDFEKRQAAEQELKAEGRWALAALKKAAETSAEPEVRSRAGNLLKPFTGE